SASKDIYHQAVMFTVTMTSAIERLAHTYIRCCSASVYVGSIGQNQKDILVATDVPDRGIDTKRCFTCIKL
ncbi:unnamed protein product, partial [Rotaria sordida]